MNWGYLLLPFSSLSLLLVKKPSFEISKSLLLISLGNLFFNTFSGSVKSEDFVNALSVLSKPLVSPFPGSFVFSTIATETP